MSNIGVCEFIAASICLIVRLLPTVLSYLNKLCRGWHTLKRQTTENRIYEKVMKCTIKVDHKGRGKREKASDLENYIFV